MTSAEADSPADVHMLVLATDITSRHGIGSYVTQSLSSLGRVRPDWSFSVVARNVSPSSSLPRRVSVVSRQARMRFVVSALLAAHRHRPRHVFVFHMRLLPLAWLCGIVGGCQVTAVTYGWELSGRGSRVQRLLLPRVSSIVAVSRWTALKVVEGSRQPTRLRLGNIDILPPTFDDAHYRPDPEAGTSFRRRHHLEPDDVMLMTVGRLDASEGYKGHEQVIRLLPRLLERGVRVRYVIVGEGTDRARLEGVAEEWGVTGNVTFLGFVEDLRGCYSAANLFVMPSTQEGFGIVFLEARACGVPVVGGAVDGSTTALGWGLSGHLCDPYSSTSIEEAIVAALGPAAEGDPRRHPAMLVADVRRDFGQSAFDSRMDDFLSRRVELGGEPAS